MKNFCKSAISDVMVAWVHVKAMRVFVESVLRFGIPPCFGAYIVAPKDGSQEKVRRRIADILGKDACGEAGDDEEDYFPYVSLNFSPFSAKKD